MSKILLIDYENVQGINLSEVEKTDCKVSVFTGSTQNKIPFDLVSSAQALGSKLSWIRIDGNGPNALDFHIAFYLGNHIAKNPNDQYYILSKDKGFDPLVKHVAKGKVACKRITNISEMGFTRRPKSIDPDLEKVLLNLQKIEKSRRPRSEGALRQHIKTILGKSGTDEKAAQAVGKLISSKAITLDNGKATYKTDNITSR